MWHRNLYCIRESGINASFNLIFVIGIYFGAKNVGKQCLWLKRGKRTFLSNCFKTYCFINLICFKHLKQLDKFFAAHMVITLFTSDYKQDSPHNHSCDIMTKFNI